MVKSIKETFSRTSATEWVSSSGKTAASTKASGPEANSTASVSIEIIKERSAEDNGLMAEECSGSHDRIYTPLITLFSGVLGFWDLL